MNESIKNYLMDIKSQPTNEFDDEQLIEALETPFHAITPCTAIGSYAGAQNPGRFATDDEKLMIVRVTHQKPAGPYEISNYPPPDQWTNLLTHPKIKYSQWNTSALEREWMIWDMGQDLTDSKDASQELYHRIIAIIPIIYQHICKQYKILIHCTNGESRSVTVATGLYMALSGLTKNNFPIENIVDYIKSIRPQIDPLHLGPLKENKDLLYSLLCNRLVVVPTLERRKKSFLATLLTERQNESVVVDCYECSNMGVGLVINNKPKCSKCQSEAVIIISDKDSEITNKPNIPTFGICHSCHSDNALIIFNRVKKNSIECSVCGSDVVVLKSDDM